MTGSAITEEEASGTYTMMLPHLGKNYGIGGGDSPLMMIDLAIEAESADDPGLRSLDVTLNLSAILPDNIDLSTVELRYLPDADSVTWEFLDGVDTYTVSPDFEQVDVSMTKDGVILLVGVLPTPDVTAVGVEWTQLTGGQIQLNWTGTGDLANPYVGGWNLYRIAGISGTTVFPETAGGINENIWEELTLDSLAASVPLDTPTGLTPLRSRPASAPPTPSFPSTGKATRTSCTPTSHAWTVQPPRSAEMPSHPPPRLRGSATRGGSPTMKHVSNSSRTGLCATRPP